MIIKEVQKFCETRRIDISIKQFYDEYKLKVDLIRNKNDCQHWFGIKFNKYYEMNEECKAMNEKQEQFLDNIQYIADKGLRPIKELNSLKKTNKRQNKSQKIAKNLTQQIREAEFELMFYWLQFNNYLSPIHTNFGQLPSYNFKKITPFKTGLNYSEELKIEGEKLDLTPQNPVDKLIVSENYNLHEIIKNQLKNCQYLIGNKILVNVCENNKEAIEQQYLQLEQIKKQIKQPNKYLQTPEQGLRFYEASKVELITEDKDGELKRVASSLNLKDHVHTRYFEQHHQFLVVTTLE